MEQIEVRHAAESDVAAVAATMHEAFRHDAVSTWIFPNELDREARHPGFMRLFVELAMTEGAVYLTPEANGVAVWFPVDPAEHGESDFVERAAAVCGDNGPRFRTLDQMMTKHHPGTEPHWYLNFLAVRPEHQSQGHGTALLRDRFRELDPSGQPAYLESSSHRSAALYVREGFSPMTPFALADDGPTMLPMWRPGRAPAGPGPVAAWGSAGRHRAEP